MSNAYKTPASNLDVAAENNSGQGKVDHYPEGVAGWSWGAFFLSWIWAIGNRTWIGLLALIPYVGIVMSVLLGMHGRKWAWQNKRWDSVEHFQSVQRKWSFWGVLIVGGVTLLGILAAIALPAYQDYAIRASGG